MCGLAGTVISRGVADIDRAWMLQALGLLEHRGPDAEGTYLSVDGRALLGHRRLAVIDTSPAASQPMIAREGVAVVLNGEVYNFRALRDVLRRNGHEFMSEGDTEVVLRAFIEWDVEFFSRLVGAFAIGIYDNRSHRLILGRDRAGEKPLYFAQPQRGLLIFGSEAKALLCHPACDKTIDLVALDAYLRLGYPPPGLSLVRGIFKLEPAHYAVWDGVEPSGRVQRYWTPPVYRHGTGSRSESDLTDELDHLLHQAVNSQLIADVPLGVLLSGGMDSSLITAYAAASQTRTKTFSVRFSGFAKYDETPHARLIANHFGTEHTEFDAADIGPEIMTTLAMQIDDPIADSSLIPTLIVSDLVRTECTVALGGDGGDELFGGYQRYSLLHALQQRVKWLPRPLRQLVSETATRTMPQGVYGRNWLKSLGQDFRAQPPSLSIMFDRPMRNKLVPSLRELSIRAEDAHTYVSGSSKAIVDRACRTDFATYLPDDILFKVDRASMMKSLEIRSPFLDVHVMNFAFGEVPSKFKADATRRKILLRQVAQRRLPEDFEFERKQGFSIPLGHWLRTDRRWRDYFQSILLDPRDSLTNKDESESLLRGLDAGRSNSESLFALVMLEQWHQEYGVHL